MSVTFDIGSETNVYVEDNTHLMDTQRGTIAANTVVQGDFIRNISGEPRCEVLSPPTIV